MSAALVFETVSLNGRGGPRLSFEVAPHHTVSIVGAEGSGVDRLGHMALGLTLPSEGRLLVFDTDLATLSRRELLAYRRRMGYLPAGDGLLQNLTLAQNVALPLRFGSNLGEQEITSRLTVVLAAVGLANSGNLRPAQATDEQRRRAALARALAFDPKLVVLEEPFVGLTDVAAREILETARGGDIAEGSRRAVLTLGPSVPGNAKSRFERRYRLARNGSLQEES